MASSWGTSSPTPTCRTCSAVRWRTSPRTAACHRLGPSPQLAADLHREFATRVSGRVVVTARRRGAARPSSVDTASPSAWSPRRRAPSWTWCSGRSGPTVSRSPSPPTTPNAPSPRRTPTSWPPAARRSAGACVAVEDSPAGVRSAERARAAPSSPYRPSPRSRRRPDGPCLDSLEQADIPLLRALARAGLRVPGPGLREVANAPAARRSASANLCRLDRVPILIVWYLPQSGEKAHSCPLHVHGRLRLGRTRADSRPSSSDPSLLESVPPRRQPRWGSSPASQRLTGAGRAAEASAVALGDAQ